MRKRSVTNIAASIRQKLLNLSKDRNEDFGFILSKYAIERLLYRLAKSKYCDEFILKGAHLFSLWFENPHRATRDLDLLCSGEALIPRLEAIFRDICEKASNIPDGIEFLTNSIHGEAIREDAFYSGVRIFIEYSLAGARDRMQIDVGFGDAVTPEPMIEMLPTLLDLPACQLKVYPRETVIAEKFEAMVSLGIINSRMRDYYDLWILSREKQFDGVILSKAIEATFNRRQTLIPKALPVALSDEFSKDSVKQTQWNSFLKKGRLRSDRPSLDIVVLELRKFLMPPVLAISTDSKFNMRWAYSHGWQRSATK